MRKKKTERCLSPNASPYLCAWLLPLQHNWLGLLSWKDTGDTHPFCTLQWPPLKQTRPISETLNTGTVKHVQTHMNSFFKVCNPMGVFPRNRHYDSSSAAQQMWSDWSWCIYPRRSTTKHSGTFACPAQFGTRLLANLISIDPLKKASSSGGNKKTNSYTKKYLWGLFLPLPPVLLLTNPWSHRHCYCAKLHYALVCGITRDHVWMWKKTHPNLNKHLTLSPRHGLDRQILSC